MVNNIAGVPSEYRKRLKLISLNTQKPLVEVQKDFIFFVKQHRSHDKMRFSKSLPTGPAPMIKTFLFWIESELRKRKEIRTIILQVSMKVNAFKMNTTKSIRETSR